MLENCDDKDEQLVGGEGAMRVEQKEASRLTSQQGGNFAGMARDGYVGTTIRGEDAVEDPFGPDILVCVRLAVESDPQFIILSKSRLDPVVREKIMDVSLTAASIARVSADAFAEIFLDFRYERVSGRQVEAVEGVVRRLETSRQGTRVEGLRGWDFLILDL